MHVILPVASELNPEWFHGQYSHKAAVLALETMQVLQDRLMYGYLLFIDDELLPDAFITFNDGPQFSLSITVRIGNGMFSESVVGSEWNAKTGKIYLTKRDFVEYMKRLKLIPPKNFITGDKLIPEI